MPFSQSSINSRSGFRSKKTANNASEDVLIAVFRMLERDQNPIWAVYY